MLKSSIEVKGLQGKKIWFPRTEDSKTTEQKILTLLHRRKRKNENKLFVPGEIKLQERAICMAVFCLSPVSIQKLIPAFLSVSIASGTPS